MNNCTHFNIKECMFRYSPVLHIIVDTVTPEMLEERRAWLEEKGLTVEGWEATLESNKGSDRKITHIWIDFEKKIAYPKCDNPDRLMRLADKIYFVFEGNDTNTGLVDDFRFYSEGPGYHQRYYFIDLSGNVHFEDFQGTGIEAKMICQRGNMFRTQKEARTVGVMMCPFQFPWQLTKIYKGLTVPQCFPDKGDKE